MLNVTWKIGNGNGEADEGISGGKDKKKVIEVLGSNKARTKEMPNEGLGSIIGVGR